MAAVSDALIQRVQKAITDQCELLLASDAFGSWKGAESLHDGDLIACNNSFLYREGQSTTKSDLYLGIEVRDGVNFTLPPIVLTANSRINMQFKRLSAKEQSNYEQRNLGTALGEQIPKLGWIVFSLAGRVGEPEPAEVSLSRVSGVDSLRYLPDQVTTAEVSKGAVVLSDISNLDRAWAAVQSRTAHSDAVDQAALAEAFESAFHALQEASMRPIDPGTVSEDCPSLLSAILERMTGQVNAFVEVLEHHEKAPADNEIYNDLLRISYNFADGASAFLRLMVGVCDLKPVLFWLTVFEQVDLAHRFEQLPFSLVGKGKPSLERYRGVIADARNQAFHDVFAFDHPFRVHLPGDALRTPELLLFREYVKRGDAALQFEDRELVELLATLTRTPERPVPVGFWRGNWEVMAGVVDAVRALRRALIVVAP